LITRQNLDEVTKDSYTWSNQNLPLNLRGFQERLIKSAEAQTTLEQTSNSQRLSEGGWQESGVKHDVGHDEVLLGRAQADLLCRA